MAPVPRLAASSTLSSPLPRLPPFPVSIRQTRQASERFPPRAWAAVAQAPEGSAPASGKSRGDVPKYQIGPLNGRGSVGLPLSRPGRGALKRTARTYANMQPSNFESADGGSSNSLRSLALLCLALDAVLDAFKAVGMDFSTFPEQGRVEDNDQRCATCTSEGGVGTAAFSKNKLGDRLSTKSRGYEGCLPNDCARPGKEARSMPLAKTCFCSGSISSDPFQCSN